MLPPNINNFNLNSDEELVTTRRKRRKVRVPMYRMVSLAGTFKNSEFTSEQSVDMFDVLLGLTSKGQKSFLELHKLYSTDDGISRVMSKDKTATQKKDFSVGFKELESKGLAKKIKKEHYLLNPRMYINPNVYESVCKMWDSI